MTTAHSPTCAVKRKAQDDLGLRGFGDSDGAVLPVKRIAPSKWNIPMVGVCYSEDPPPPPEKPEEERDTTSGKIIYQEDKVRPHVNPCWIPDDVEPTRENLLKYLKITPEEQVEIWNYAQRDPRWHHHRRGRMSGSKMGPAAGHSPYCSPRGLIKQWLYVAVQDNYAMKHGRDFEPVALEMYRMWKLRQNTPDKVVIPFTDPPSYLNPEHQVIDDIQPLETFNDEPYSIRIEQRGLIVHLEKNWMGYSPDGEVYETDQKLLLEIKCPRKLYGEIPWMYYDQIQSGMWQLGLQVADFFVYTRESMKLERYAFNKRYWEEDLYPAVEKFYFEEFIPEAIEAIKAHRRGPPPVKKRRTLNL